MPASVTAIVRAKDKEAEIARALTSLKRQTVVPEILVVDSGSTDRTVEVARRWCDGLIEISESEFTYGRALNLGAEAAAGEIHLALSAHCELPRPDWIELALECYVRDDVAAATGMPALPDGAPVRPRQIFHQTVEHVERWPEWGMSNHAATWRAATWTRHRFDERLEYAEDKEWALRVLRDGWTIAYRPELAVDLSHQWRQGFVQYYRRQRRAAEAVGGFAPNPASAVRQCLAEWWDEPLDPRPDWRRRLNPMRTAGFVGRLLGYRAAARTRRRATNGDAAR